MAKTKKAAFLHERFSGWYLEDGHLMDGYEPLIGFFPLNKRTTSSWMPRKKGDIAEISPAKRYKAYMFKC